VDVDLSAVDDFGMVVATHAISMPKVTIRIAKRRSAFIIFSFMAINVPKKKLMAFCEWRRPAPQHVAALPKAGAGKEDNAAVLDGEDAAGETG
jgi:hypothetical protein